MTYLQALARMENAAKQLREQDGNLSSNQHRDFMKELARAAKVLGLKNIEV